MRVIKENGNKYGKLTVLHRAPAPKELSPTLVYWLCQCQCGRQIVRSGVYLRQSLQAKVPYTANCGHPPCCPSAFKDESGKQHGKLAVLHRAPAPDGKRGAHFLCQCECGREVVRSGSALRSGIKGCGYYPCSSTGIKDEAGNRYGKLTVLERAATPPGIKPGPAFWQCRCECGRETAVRGCDLRNGTTQSCGERPCRSVGELPPGEAAFNLLINDYRRKAKRRGISFELTRQQFRELTQRPCHYCGIEPSRRHYYRSVNNGASQYIYNGIDRFDGQIGYTTANSVPCCTECNYAKSDRPFKEFAAWAKRLAAHLEANP